MSQVVHPLASVIDTCPDLQTQAMKTLCSAARQFGSRLFQNYIVLKIDQ